LANRVRIRELEATASIMIRTLCRVCEKPALVRLSSDYETAVVDAHWIDDRVMEHEGHKESGGWGFHWRLDDVLRTAFPTTHWEELFPMPAWYRYRSTSPVELTVLRVVKRNGVDRIL
jgi:hypothetical protein